MSINSKVRSHRRRDLNQLKKAGIEKKPRILYYDIETSPLLGHSWQTWDTNIIKVEREWYIMSFAYKWEGEKTVTAVSLPDFALYKKEPHNDRDMMKVLWKLHNEADIVVAHNGNAFDNKKVNARFLYHGMGAPAPYKTVDTLLVARKYFKLTSNKLNDVCSHLGLGEKVKTGGLDLWLDCLKGDQKAWKQMVKYNKGDVILLQDLYKKLRGWMATGHPNVALYGEIECACPVCGSLNIQKRGFSRTAKRIYQRYQCTGEDGCGVWFQGQRIKV